MGETVSQRENLARYHISEASKGRRESYRWTRLQGGRHSLAEGVIGGLAGELGAGEKFFQFAGMCRAIPEWGTWGLGVMRLSPCLEEYEGEKGHADGPTGADVLGTRQYHYWNDQTGCRMQPASLRSGKRRAHVVWDTSAVSHPREKLGDVWRGDVLPNTVHYEERQTRGR